MAPLNGIKHAAHTAIGDCSATLEIAKIIKKKAPSVWDSSLLTSNKEESLKIIKNEKLFVLMNFTMEKLSLSFKLLFVNIRFINGQKHLI